MDVQKTRALSDLELLEIEMDLLWGSEAGPELVLACARDGVRARIGEQVPPKVARTVAAQIEEAPHQLRTRGLRYRNWNARAWRWRMHLVRRSGSRLDLGPAT